MIQYRLPIVTSQIFKYARIESNHKYCGNINSGSVAMTVPLVVLTISELHEIFQTFVVVVVMCDFV